MFSSWILVAALVLQEGHPLVGSWHGNWGTDATNRSDFTVVMDWDGKTISSAVRPSPTLAGRPRESRCGPRTEGLLECDAR